MITSILFDMDGTLYDEPAVKVKAELLTAVWLQERTNIAAEDVYSIFRETKSRITQERKGSPEANDRQIWYQEVLRQLGAANVSGAEAADYYWKIVYDNMEPFADLLYVLPYLAQRYRLFVLTDELPEIYQKKMERLGLEQYFTAAVSSGKVGETKPSPRLFQYALSVIGEKAEHVLMVGDNPSADVKGGNLVGMPTAWLQRGKYFYYPQNEFEKPQIVFTNYLQLEQKIQRLAAKKHEDIGKNR